MRNNTMLTWGIAIVMAMGVAAPALAQNDKSDAKHTDGRARVRVVVRQGDDQEDSRAFQQWYGAQMRNYNDRDSVTGERIGDLLQLVVEVNQNQVWILDQQNIRRPAFISARTQILFPEFKNDRGNRNNPFRNRQRGHDFASMLNPGDMVIVEGYLRATGGILATRIRVIDRASGWYTDDEDTNTTSGYGYRFWGDVQLLDLRRAVIEVNTNAGRRRISLGQEGRLWMNGKNVNLSNLHRGDRVVCYTNQNTDGAIIAYRIVILQSSDSYPIGNRPHWCDPDGNGKHTDGNIDRSKPLVEGRLDYVSTGLLFNKIVMRGGNGQQVTVFAPKSLEAVDRDGSRVSMLNLHDGDRMRVYYNELGGSYFAQRVEIW